MKLLRFLILLSFFAVSCNVINKEEGVASYVQIDELQLDVGSQFGNESHNITDVWVSANDQFIGVFELPTIVPILAQGDVKIGISGGIQNNGISTNRIEYPLTETFFTTVNLVPEETTTILPTLTYFDDLEMNVSSENFSIGSAFNEDEGFLNRVEDPSLDSSPLNDIWVGQLLPEDGGNRVQVSSIAAIDVTDNGPTMLELNYKSNQNFVVGLIRFNSSGEVKDYLVGLNTTYNDQGELEWRKVYVNLEAQMNFYPTQGALAYRFFFESETDIPEPLIFIDNIKLIHLIQ